MNLLYNVLKVLKYLAGVGAAIGAFLLLRKSGPDAAQISANAKEAEKEQTVGNAELSAKEKVDAAYDAQVAAMRAAAKEQAHALKDSPDALSQALIQAGRSKPVDPKLH